MLLSVVAQQSVFDDEKTDLLLLVVDFLIVYSMTFEISVYPVGTLDETAVMLNDNIAQAKVIEETTVFLLVL